MTGGEVVCVCVCVVWGCEGVGVGGGVVVGGRDVGIWHIK